MMDQEEGHRSGLAKEVWEVEDEEVRTEAQTNAYSITIPRNIQIQSK